MISKEWWDRASAITLHFPSMKNTWRSMPCSIRIKAADMSTELYGSDVRRELNMLKELEESVWMASRLGTGWSVDAQWMAARIAMASLRKILKRLSGRTGSPKKAQECVGAQKPSPSLQASDQISSSASWVDHSSASNNLTPSKWSLETANHSKSS